MFIMSGRGWYVGGEQRSSGSFLLLCLPDKPEGGITWQCPWTGAEWDGPQCGADLKADGDSSSRDVKCPECGRISIEPMYIAPCDDLRCFVRHTELHSLGHWMMGRMRLHGEHISLSGCYGGDGLPVTVRRKTWERGVPLPANLIDELRNGGGHNSSGSEGPAIREWAVDHIKELRRASRRSREVERSADVRAEEAVEGR